MKHRSLSATKTSSMLILRLTKQYERQPHIIARSDRLSEKKQQATIPETKQLTVHISVVAQNVGYLLP
jgi:hypothetical protein